MWEKVALPVFSNMSSPSVGAAAGSNKNYQLKLYFYVQLSQWSTNRGKYISSISNFSEELHHNLGQCELYCPNYHNTSIFDSANEARLYLVLLFLKYCYQPIVILNSYGYFID